MRQKSKPDRLRPVLLVFRVQDKKSVLPMAGKSKPGKRKRPYKIEDFYELFQRQKEFHDSGAKYRLFGGAAGPGKTKALLYEAIYQAQLHPGVDTLLLRRTYPELEKSLITYFRRDVPRKLFKKYNDSKHVV